MSFLNGTPVLKLSNLKNNVIKILQLVTERQYRGAQVFAAGLSGLLADKGHEVLFVGLYPLKQNVLSAPGARNFDLPGKKTIFDFSLLRKVMKLIREEKPDIIQANGSDTLKYLAVAKLFYPRMILVYRNISMVSAFSSKKSLKRTFNRLLFKQVDRVSSVGDESLNDLVNTYGFPREHTKVIKRWVPYVPNDPVAARKKIITEFNLPETAFILINVAKFAPEKNQAYVLETFEKIQKLRPHAVLLFVGEGKDLETVKALAVKKKLDKKVFFTGYRKNVPEIMAGSDLFMLGSLVEGVPGVIMEAATQSIPAVAVSSGGVSEVVVTGKTGILLEGYNSDEFCSAVLTLMDDEALRKQLGANVKEFVLKNYTSEGAISAFEALFTEVLEEKAALWSKK